MRLALPARPPRSPDVPDLSDPPQGPWRDGSAVMYSNAYRKLTADRFAVALSALMQ